MTTTHDTTLAAPLTVSHFLGEMAWLLTQSPLHRGLSIADLEWLIMPALLHEQFYVFRDGQQPVGLALWAKCSPAAAGKLGKGMIEPENRPTSFPARSRARSFGSIRQIRRQGRERSRWCRRMQASGCAKPSKKPPKHNPTFNGYVRHTKSRAFPLPRNAWAGLFMGNGESGMPRKTL